MKKKILAIVAVAVLCASCSFAEKQTPKQEAPQQKSEYMQDKESFEKAHKETKERIEKKEKEFDERQKANAGKK